MVNRYKHNEIIAIHNREDCETIELDMIQGEI